MKFKERPNTGIFLKIPSGQSVKGVFRGEPFDFYSHWSEAGALVCTGEGCASCQDGVKKAFRFRLNLLVNEEGNYIAKIFEQGGPVWDALKSLSSDYDLEKTVVKITRTGEKKQTKYSIIPLPGPIPEETEKKMSLVKLHALSGHVEAHEGEVEVPDDAVPF